MQTSRRLLGQVRRAMLMAWVFAVCIGILSLVLPLFALYLFDIAVPDVSIRPLVVLAAMAAIGLLVAGVLDYCRELILLRAGLWLGHTLGQALLAAGLEQDGSADEIKSRAGALAELRDALTGGDLWPVLDLPWIFAACAIAYLLAPTLGLVIAVTGVALLLCAVLLQFVTPGVGRIRDGAAGWLDAVVAADSPMRGSAQGAVRQWDLRNRCHVAAVYAAGRRGSLFKAAARIIRATGLIVLLWFGGELVMAKELTAGALVAALLLSARAIEPFEQLVLGFDRLRAVHRSWLLLQSFNIEYAPVEASNPKNGRVVITNATWHYPKCATPALRDIHLTIEPGECIGIIGPSGAGKSALAALIAGVAMPVAGRAEIDGIPIAVRLRFAGEGVVGYLPDAPRLIEGSVQDNITGFEPQAESSASAAALRAGVHELLSKLPSGYDTQVGIDGAALPLRARRAVALARAVYGMPGWIVLDEPELGLDNTGIMRLGEALRAIRADGVGLVIATQEPRLLRLVDRVVVLSGGTIESVLPGHQVLGGRGTLGSPSIATLRQVA